jgi:RNA polymerase sigma-70 factor (ECF subfamily)
VLDTHAFEALYRAEEERLFNIAYRWTWNAADAAELVHEAFARIWDRRRSVDPERAPAYAARTVVNLCHKRARRRRRWQRVRQALHLDPERPAQPTDRYEQDIVRRAVEALPDDLRDVLLLTEFAGLKQREIADILNIPPGTIASRRNRALKKLEEFL